MAFRILLALTLGLGALNARADDRNPVGERADYDLDHDSSRTSSLVTDGNMTAYVLSEAPDGSAYDTHLDYRLKIRLVGWKSGAKSVAIDGAFFTPDFMAQLRASGEYDSAEFKIKWLGFIDAHTKDGRDYPQCDRVLIYDLSSKSDAPLVAAARGILTAALGGPSTDSTIDDMQIKAAIYAGIPVLGAVKLDVSGKYKGQNVKVGADYKSP